MSASANPNLVKLKQKKAKRKKFQNSSSNVPSAAAAGAVNESVAANSGQLPRDTSSAIVEETAATSARESSLHQLVGSVVLPGQLLEEEADALEGWQESLDCGGHRGTRRGVGLGPGLVRRGRWVLVTLDGVLREGGPGAASEGGHCGAPEGCGEETEGRTRRRQRTRVLLGGDARGGGRDVRAGRERARHRSARRPRGRLVPRGHRRDAYGDTEWPRFRKRHEAHAARPACGRLAVDASGHSTRGRDGAIVCGGRREGQRTRPSRALAARRRRHRLRHNHYRRVPRRTSCRRWWRWRINISFCYAVTSRWPELVPRGVLRATRVSRTAALRQPGGLQDRRHRVFRAHHRSERTVRHPQYSRENLDLGICNKEIF